ncbi:MAG: hypothetical protein V9H25_21590 [Candidatus Competibacter sp.]
MASLVPMFHAPIRANIAFFRIVASSKPIAKPLADLCAAQSVRSPSFSLASETGRAHRTQQFKLQGKFVEG